MKPKFYIVRLSINTTKPFIQIIPGRRPMDAYSPEVFTSSSGVVIQDWSQNSPIQNRIPIAGQMAPPGLPAVPTRPMPISTLSDRRMAFRKGFTNQIGVWFSYSRIKTRVK